MWFRSQSIVGSYLGQEKNIYEILVFDREFSVRSPSPVRGFWKSPRAARRALGDFQNPLQTQGIWVKIPSQKPEFLIYIYIPSNY